MVHIHFGVEDCAIDARRKKRVERRRWSEGVIIKSRREAGEMEKGSWSEETERWRKREEEAGSRVCGAKPKGLSATAGHRSSNSSSSGHPGCESAFLQTSILVSYVGFYNNFFCIINLVHTLTAFLLY